MDDKVTAEEYERHIMPRVLQRARDAALGAAVRKQLETTPCYDDGMPTFLRKLASCIADPSVYETEAAYHLLRCIADALEEEAE